MALPVDALETFEHQQRALKASGEKFLPEMVMDAALTPLLAPAHLVYTAAETKKSASAAGVTRPSTSAFSVLARDHSKHAQAAPAAAPPSAAGPAHVGDTAPDSPGATPLASEWPASREPSESGSAEESALGATTLPEAAAAAAREHGCACSRSGARAGGGADDALNDVECYAETLAESPSEPRAESGETLDGAADSLDGVQSWHAGSVSKAPMPSPAGVPGQTVKKAGDAGGVAACGGVPGKRIKIPGSLRCQVAEAVREFQMIGPGDKVGRGWRHATDAITHTHTHTKHTHTHTHTHTH